MADEECTPTSYEIEGCCTPPLVSNTPGSGVPGPPGPPGSSGLRAIVFNFGSDKSNLTTGMRLTFPVPSYMNATTMQRWRIRKTSEAGDITFTLHKAPSLSAAAVALTGVTPTIVGVRGGSGNLGNLSDTQLNQDQVLEAEITAVTVGIKQATLVIEVNIP